jgi:hypothetical protein
MTVTGRKFIAPKEPNAGILKWSFKTLVTGQYMVAILCNLRNLYLLIVEQPDDFFLKNLLHCGARTDGVERLKSPLKPRVSRLS